MTYVIAYNSVMDFCLGINVTDSEVNSSISNLKSTAGLTKDFSSGNWTNNSNTHGETITAHGEIVTAHGEIITIMGKQQLLGRK